LLAFAAGFLVRPFGALLFGRIGDRRPPYISCHHDDHGHRLSRRPAAGYASWGIAAPVILIILRMLCVCAGGIMAVPRPIAARAGRPRGFCVVDPDRQLGLFLSLSS
jgi:MFS family permease